MCPVELVGVCPEGCPNVIHRVVNRFGESEWVGAEVLFSAHLDGCSDEGVAVVVSCVTELLGCLAHALFEWDVEFVEEFGDGCGAVGECFGGCELDGDGAVVGFGVVDGDVVGCPGDAAVGALEGDSCLGSGEPVDDVDVVVLC